MKQVAGREYAFVSATAWNRRSFIVVFREAIQHLLNTDVTVSDFHQLLLLLCPDFPRSTLDAIVHVLPRALLCDGQFCCATLATAFEVHWFHAKFLSALDPFFRRLVSIDPAASGGVTVPTAPPPGATGGSTPSTSLPVADLAAAVCYLNTSKASQQSHPAAIAWPVVERSLGAAGFEKAVSFRRLCQCLIQSESLAARLHARPESALCSDETVCALVEGRTCSRTLLVDAEGRKSPETAAADAARCLSPPAKGMQKRGKSIRKKTVVQPAPEKTGFES